MVRVLQTAIPIIVIILPILVVSCSAGNGAENPTPVSIAQVKILGNTKPEYREVNVEVVPQNNCGGNAEVENEITKSRSIAHTVEVGSGLEVNANGEIGIPGNTANIEIGATVANQLGYTYGTEDALSRSITVKAKAHTFVEHRVKQNEVWEVGTVEIIIGDQSIEIPFSFRTDFSIQLVDSTESNEKCGFTPTPTNTPFPTSTHTPDFTPTPTNTPFPTATYTPDFTPTPTDTPFPTSTHTPTPEPTSTDTPTPDTRLRVGETWQEDGIRITLRDVEFETDGDIIIDLILENNAGNEIIYSWDGEDNFRLVDNLGNKYLSDAWCSNADEVVKPGESQGFHTCNWGTGLYFSSNKEFFNQAVTEMTLTVQRVSRIQNAQWFIPVPH